MKWGIAQQFQYLVFAWIVLALLTPVGAAANIQVVDGLIERAVSARLNGDYMAAEGLLSRAQRISPRHGGVYLEYAKLRKDQGAYADMREIVEVGAAMAEGPPDSIAQLKILENELAVLLPVSPTDDLLTPPVAAKASSKSQNPAQSEAKLASVPSRAPVVAENDDSFRSVGQAEPARLEVERRERAIRQMPVSREEEAVTIREPSSTVVAPVVVEAEALESEDDSGGLESSASVNATASIQDERFQSNRRVSSDIASVASGNQEANQEANQVRASAKLLKTQFSGVGVLNKVQSGTWISRGPIEVDF
jgi:hypothetical protein